jgi:hypothetical protein
MDARSVISPRINHLEALQKVTNPFGIDLALSFRKETRPSETL